MMKTITKEQYIRIFEGIENYIEKRLDWRTNQTLKVSFRAAYNGLLGRTNDDKDSQRFKMSCITRYLERAEYDKVIRRMIIYKYTREDNLAITFDNGDREIFKKGLDLVDMERLGY
jgi:hypothetical protein